LLAAHSEALFPTKDYTNFTCSICSPTDQSIHSFINLLAGLLQRVSTESIPCHVLEGNNPAIPALRLFGAACGAAEIFDAFLGLWGVFMV
jgi:hypothetical protein